MPGSYIKKRREMNQATRTGGMTFIDNYLPAKMPIEQIEMLIRLQTSARETGRTTGEQIVVPTKTGQWLSRNEYDLDQRAQQIKHKTLVELAWFQKRLDKEPKEWVENWTDQHYRGMLQGQMYIVPARGRKQLPMTLAQHYRTKNGIVQQQHEYEQRMGALLEDEAPTMDTEEFRAAVDSYDGIGFENPVRKIIY